MVTELQVFVQVGGVAYWLDRRFCRRAFPIPALD